MTALTAWPEPIGPTWVIVLPSRARIGRARSTSAGVATDEDRQGRLLGALAAAGDRGVDDRDPALAPAARRSRGSPTGAIVEQSMTRRRAGALGHAVGAEQDRLDVRRVGDADDDDVACRGTTSAGVAASFARQLDEAPASPGVRFQTVSGKPAPARWPAIAAPIVPSPTNPIRSSATSSSLPFPRSAADR